VRVRFVLREQCTFGHSFHLVGDDPALGLWDPANAAALEWSEGHDWTVEKVRDSCYAQCLVIKHSF
jgi:hypothetical protein